MQAQTLQAAYGCLLHDFGKIVYRAGGQEGTHSQLGWSALHRLLPHAAWQPVLDCLRWHHAAEIRKTPPDAHHPAYIACIADNLSAAADRRTVEGEGGHFVRDLPLSPVFSHMKGEHGGFSLSPLPQDGQLRLPQAGKVSISAGRYADAQRAIEAELKDTLPVEERLNSLLVLLESWTAGFPSSTFTGESPDISIYDHLKTTAAIGSCISEYLLDQGETDLRQCLFVNEKDFRASKAFLLYSADLSGIQRFIYQGEQKSALRSLRSRSFFLGLLMEHYVDEILAGCGLSRANLLYSGGGHCYLLLPNTEKTVDFLGAYNERFNDFLLAEFGTSLFLAHGWTECCGNDLTNTPAQEAPYKAMFRRVSSAIAAHKHHRYSARQLLFLNRKRGGGERECRICGREDILDAGLCRWCQTFIDLSGKIQGKDVYVVSTGDAFTPDFSLPTPDGTAHFLFTDEDYARKLLKKDDQIRRIYTKNKSCTGLRYSTRIYVGDYASSNLMEELADKAEGIRRLGVCRMDVDDLGEAFVRGFEVPGAQDAQEQYHYVTLSRTAAFSRQMSLFFQLYINEILQGLAVSIVYSGGDDVFFLGAWNDVLEAANHIQHAFAAFTCGALTISGGVGIFDDHFPVRTAAARVAELEERAKQEPGKNALALFDSRARHTYPWDVFRENIQNEKVALLEDFFRGFEDRGNACLYRLMHLLRPEQEEDGPINLARYAYQLARMEPKRRDPRWELYRKFADQMYRWGWNRTEREELITAIYLYVYQNRKV